MNKRQDLIQAIRMAFSGTSRPPDEETVMLNAIDTYELSLTLDAVHGRVWEDLDYESIMKFRQLTSYLTNSGLAYYLPGFMIAILKYGYRLDVLYDILLDWMRPSHHFGPWENLLDELVLRLNCEQRSILFEFFVFLSLEPELEDELPQMREAMEKGVSFWKEHLC